MSLCVTVCLWVGGWVCGCGCVREEIRERERKEKARKKPKNTIILRSLFSQCRKLSFICLELKYLNCKRFRLEVSGLKSAKMVPDERCEVSLSKENENFKLSTKFHHSKIRLCKAPIFGRVLSLLSFKVT